MKLDEVDFKILRLLTENSRVSWKDLGEAIHMTGQAVGNRIKKLEDSGVITAYTLAVDELKIGISYTAFIIIYMKSANHEAFVRYVEARKEIVEAHRVAGEGCYHLKIKIDTQEKLNTIVNEVLEHGNYQLYLSVNKVKDHVSLLEAVD